MLPVERELKQPAKALMLASFGIAAVASGYGVFSLNSSLLFGVELPKGAVPVFVVVMLGVGALFLRWSLGEERCRSCKLPLEQRWLAFAASDATAAMRSAERGDASQLPTPARHRTDEGSLIAVCYCARCRQVATLEGFGPGRVTVVSRHSILGPSVERWIEQVELEPSRSA